MIPEIIFGNMARFDRMTERLPPQRLNLLNALHPTNLDV